MITNSKTTVACRCPECGAIIRKELNIFELSGGNMDIPCDVCGMAKINITLSRDGKVRLLVPCLACPNPHPFTLGSTNFFEREIFILQCSFTGLDICFIGSDKDQIDMALERSGEVINQLIEENEENEQSKNFAPRNKSPFANDVVMHNVLVAIENLAAKNSIFCLCSEKDEKPSLSVEIDFDRVHIRCKKCNCSSTLDAATNIDSNNAIDMENLYLN